MAISNLPLPKALSRELILFLLFVFSGSALSLLLLPGEKRKAPLYEISATLLGESIAVDEVDKDQVEEKLRKFLRETFRLYLPDGSYEVFGINELEAEVDQARLESLLVDVTDPRSLLNQGWANRRSTLIAAKK